MLPSISVYSCITSCVDDNEGASKFLQSGLESSLKRMSEQTTVASADWFRGSHHISKPQAATYLCLKGLIENCSRLGLSATSITICINKQYGRLLLCIYGIWYIYLYERSNVHQKGNMSRLFDLR